MCIEQYSSIKRITDIFERERKSSMSVIYFYYAQCAYISTKIKILIPLGFNELKVVRGFSIVNTCNFRAVFLIFDNTGNVYNIF